jgi:ABC-2 type transport system ATP-binding protein
LTRAFGRLVAVDELTLAIPEGTVFGFLGPNGAGKTTTVRLLSALIAPTSGSAAVAGYRLGEHNEAIRKAVGILTETPGLYDRLSAWQNLLFFAEMYDLPASRARSQVEQYLRLLDLWERRDDKVGGFSKGMRQKLAIARALLHEPQVIFLDEPTSTTLLVSPGTEGFDLLGVEQPENEILEEPEEHLPMHARQRASRDGGGEKPLQRAEAA